MAAAHIMCRLLYALHQYGYGPFLGLVYSQTITPTFLKLLLGQFCTGLDEVIDILPRIIRVNQILLQVQPIVR